MTSRTRTLLVAFALLGLGAASASAYVHYRLVTDPSYSSACDISATVSCTQAYLSRYGSFWGVPVALGGILYFALVLLLSALGGRRNDAERENIAGYIFVTVDGRAGVRALPRVGIVLPAEGRLPVVRDHLCCRRCCLHHFWRSHEIAHDHIASARGA